MRFFLRCNFMTCLVDTKVPRTLPTFPTSDLTERNFPKSDEKRYDERRRKKSCCRSEVRNGDRNGKRGNISVFISPIVVSSAQQ